ncbi:hypothetical protein [Anabaena sp. CS-542/02]|nr:hypothetical protein [Anabaena sp. CS-542/02]
MMVFCGNIDFFAVRICLNTWAVRRTKSDRLSYTWLSDRPLTVT